MFRGVRLGGLSFQPSVEADYGNGAIGVWGNFPLRNKIDGVSDPEIDPYCSYTFTINEHLSIVPGASLYTYPRADTGAGSFRTTFEPNFTVNLTAGGVTFSPKLYYDLVLKGPTAEFAAAYSVPLKEAGTSLDFSATVGTYKWDDAANGASPRLKNWGDYFQAGVSVPFELPHKATLRFGLVYQKGSNNYYKQEFTAKVRNDAAVGRGVLSVSYSWSF